MVPHLPQFSEDFQRAFWNRPLWATPFIIGSDDTGSVAINTETGILFEKDVPADTNGLRIEKIYGFGQATLNVVGGCGGIKFRIYTRDVRVVGPTQNIRQYLELKMPFASPAQIVDVAWYIEPGVHWQATYINGNQAALVRSSVVLSGYYF